MTSRNLWLTFFFCCAAAGALAQEEMAGVDPEDEVIHLDKTDEERDPASSFRPPEMDANRDPGVMWIGRTFNPGVKSFFGLPVALTPEDLRAAEIDVAIFGAPVDMGVGMRGAGKGPDALRANITGTGNSGGLPHMHVGVAWKRALRAVLT